MEMSSKPVYSMTTKISMLVKCEKCGYENFPQHRFCGMCAAPLPFPTAPGIRPNPEPRPPAPRPISRAAPTAVEREPSSARNLSYLLEDEPGPSHGGKYFLALLLLLVALGVVGWHWRGDWSALIARLSNSAPSNSSAPATAGSPSDTVPPASVNGGAAQSGAGTVDQAPATQTQAPPAARADDSGQGSQVDQAQPSNSSPQNDSAAATPDDSEEATPPPAPARKAPKMRAQPAAAPAAQASDLEAEGEKYLYGNGVPENCTRARTNLLAAAQHSNAQAQNVLGTMYATGHCATRDLPTAYRWFSRSLRKDPSNTRIEQDLKVLWNQMTPEERQLALRDAR
jgi:cytoskeletal protein RodZ